MLMVEANKSALPATGHAVWPLRGKAAEVAEYITGQRKAKSRTVHGLLDIGRVTKKHGDRLELIRWTYAPVEESPPTGANRRLPGFVVWIEAKDAGEKGDEKRDGPASAAARRGKKADDLASPPQDWFRSAPFRYLGFSSPAEEDYRQFVMLASSKRVQDDIEATKIQQETLNRLFQSLINNPRRNVTLWKETRQLIEAALTAKQNKRIEQIVFQRCGHAVFFYPKLAPELKLTEEQRDRLRAKLHEHIKRVKDNREAGGPRTFGGESYRRFWNQVYHVLTEEQREKFQELRGPPIGEEKTPEKGDRPASQDDREPEDRPSKEVRGPEPRAQQAQSGVGADDPEVKKAFDKVIDWIEKQEPPRKQAEGKGVPDDVQQAIQRGLEWLKNHPQQNNDVRQPSMTKFALEALLNVKKDRKPDGVIRWVDNKTQLVWINLGVVDGLKRRTVFSVLSTADHAAGLSERGSIRVTRIIGPHLSEARVLTQHHTRRIAKGDSIFSPVWSPGLEFQVAIVGEIDLDGDGKSDRVLLRKLVAEYGGRIIDEVDDAGNRKGEGLKVETKFLVVGRIPDPNSLNDRQQREIAQKVLNHYREMIGQARKLGVRTITLKDLAAYISQRSVDQTAERFSIPQKKPAAATRLDRPVKILRATQFDKYGRRTCRVKTGNQSFELIQGITEITPKWTTIISLGEYEWKTRIPTKSLDRNTLNLIIYRNIDPKNLPQRKAVVRFYLQAERLQDALRELEQVARDFPNP
jgi:hypothetical protein